MKASFGLRTFRRARRWLLPRDVAAADERESLATAAALAEDARRQGRRALARYWATEFAALVAAAVAVRRADDDAPYHLVPSGSRSSSMWMAFRRDVRYGVRLLVRTPGFTIVAVLTVALGIGANTAIFSVVNAVLLRPLPYSEPDRLVQICRAYPNNVACSVSIPKFMAWRRATAFDAVAAYDFAGPGMNLGGGDRPEQVRGIHVSADYFRVFGAAPAAGRTFSAEEDRPGGPHVAILTHRLWVSRFGADPSIVGRPLTVNGDPQTVIGILPAEFRPDPPADLFLPLQADPNSANQGHFLSVAGRLKPGVRVEQAGSELRAIGEQFRRDNPRWMSDNEHVTARPLRDALVGDVRPALLILLGAVALVLLMACANVAGLLLARAAGRMKEIAVRAAIGAGRGTIVRQLLTESLLLTAGGAVVGVCTGIAGVRTLIALGPGDLPRIKDLAELPLMAFLVDWRLLGFTAAISLATGLLFGSAPALHLARADLGVTLKEAGGRGSAGAGATRVRSALVVTEIALAVVLLVGATLLIRTFVSLRRVEPGFEPRNVLTMQTSLAGSAYASTARLERLTRDVTARIDAVPGVAASAWTISLPTEGGTDLPFTIEGRPLTGKASYHGEEQYRTISRGYFAALSIPLVQGRLFEERDGSAGAPVAIINRAMARQYWPEANPLGQRINIGGGLGPEFEDSTREIVGIVGDVRDNGLNEPAPGIMYVPVGQAPDGLTRLVNSVVPTAWLIRASANPLALAGRIQQEFLAVDPLLPVARVRTMEQVLAESIAQQNFNMLLLTIFGAIALVLAGIGTYGLMSYSVEQSTHDIGVRLALGADRQNILTLVMSRGIRLAGIGLLAGAAAAAGAGRLLTSMLFGVRPLDPVAFSLVLALLGIIALVACYLPARRAMTVDPISALRQ